jgi:hypothetical protein
MPVSLERTIKTPSLSLNSAMSSGLRELRRRALSFDRIVGYVQVREYCFSS